MPSLRTIIANTAADMRTRLTGRSKFNHGDPFGPPAIHGHPYPGPTGSPPGSPRFLGPPVQAPHGTAVDPRISPEWHLVHATAASHHAIRVGHIGAGTGLQQDHSLTQGSTTGHVLPTMVPVDPIPIHPPSGATWHKGPPGPPVIYRPPA